MMHARDLTAVPPAAMAALETRMPDLWPEALREFGRVFFTGLLNSKGVGQSIDSLACIAVEQVQVLSHQLGGQQPYIPAACAVKTAEAAAAVQNGFNGHNHAELSYRLGITVSTVRRILKKQAANISR